MIGASCAGCAFFVPRNLIPDDNWGECHRDAPRTFGGFQGQPSWAWPPITSDQWCGEFAAKPQPGAHLEPGPIQTRPDFLGNLNALVDQVRNGLAYCDHGSLGATCHICVAEQLSRYGR